MINGVCENIMCYIKIALLQDDASQYSCNYKQFEMDRVLDLPFIGNDIPPGVVKYNLPTSQDVDLFPIYGSSKLPAIGRL